MASYINIGSQKKAIGDQGNDTYVSHGGTVIDMSKSKVRQKEQEPTYTPPKNTNVQTNVSATTPTTTNVGGGYDYASMVNSMLAQQRAAAEQAYGNAKARLEDAWGSTLSSLEDNRNSALNQIRQNYDYTSGKAQDDANKSLREAYVNYMLNKRNMNQNLSAMGVSGGSSESTLANMYNNYGNSRNNINTTLADNLASLLNAYQNNVASVNQAYNSQYADARNNYMANLNQLESALANNLVSQYSGGSLSNLANYASTLSGLVNSMANESFVPTENTLGVNSVSTQQGVANDPGTSTNYAKYKALRDDLLASGLDQKEVVRQLQMAGATPQEQLALYGLL